VLNSTKPTVVRELRLDSVVNRALTDHKGSVDVNMNFRNIDQLGTVKQTKQTKVNVKVVKIDPVDQARLDKMQKLMEAMVNSNN
jgi:hypothetical protein